MQWETFAFREEVLCLTKEGAMGQAVRNWGQLAGYGARRTWEESRPTGSIPHETINNAGTGALAGALASALTSGKGQRGRGAVEGAGVGALAGALTAPATTMLYRSRPHWSTHAAHMLAPDLVSAGVGGALGLRRKSKIQQILDRAHDKEGPGQPVKEAFAFRQKGSISNAPTKQEETSRRHKLVSVGVGTGAGAATYMGAKHLQGVAAKASWRNMSREKHPTEWQSHADRLRATGSKLVPGTLKDFSSGGVPHFHPSTQTVHMAGLPSAAVLAHEVGHATDPRRSLLSHARRIGFGMGVGLQSGSVMLGASGVAANKSRDSEKLFRSSRNWGLLGAAAHAVPLLMDEGRATANALKHAPSGRRGAYLKELAPGFATHAAHSAKHLALPAVAEVLRRRAKRRAEAEDKQTSVEKEAALGPRGEKNVRTAKRVFREAGGISAGMFGGYALGTGAGQLIKNTKMYSNLPGENKLRALQLSGALIGGAGMASASLAKRIARAQDRREARLARESQKASRE